MNKNKNIKIIKTNTEKNMTDEQKQKYKVTNEQNQKYRKNTTDEQKQKYKDHQKEYRKKHYR